MELKEIYKDGNSIATIQGGRRIEIKNDPKQFKLYKSLGLDVFKEVVIKEKKKKVDSSNKG